MKNQRINLAFRFLIPLLLLTGVLSLQNSKISQIASQDKTDYLKEENSTRAILNLQKNLPAFGFHNLVADWNFLGYIQYFGDGKAREQTGYSLIPDFFEIMSERDPHFIQAYLQMSTANSIYAARPDKTVEFMNKILRSLSPETSPLSPYVWIYKGVDEILYLGNLKAAQNSYEMASKWASIQGNKYMADQTAATAQFLASNPNPKKAQISAWATILTTTPDQKTQRYALDKMRSLGAEVFITPQGQLQIKIPE
jgi:hypothetical protein